VEAVCPGTGLAALLDKPNNNLAVEYCKAILELGASLVPIPLPRQGADHGQALTETGGQFASASALRTLWQNGGADAAAPYVPVEVLPLYREAFAAGQYTDPAAAQRCQLALLRSRCAGTAPFAQVRGISEGLEHRLEAAVRSSTTHAELLDSLTTVRYPRARMRRLAMDAALGYSADVFPALPPYLHLLGAQKDALPLLKAAALPVSHSLARLAEQNAPCRAVVDAQLRACDFGALCRKKPEPMGGALRQKIIFLTK
jgi:predicted nucleotidyltransferase